tara:strand:- start:571 stop:885 length:315 start_codon:yes stop_codon:yes gene_type:complete
MKPQKHAALIHLWADGAEIELKFDDGAWRDPGYAPSWFDDCEYRVKPKPDVVLYKKMCYGGGRIVMWKGAESGSEINAKLTFDGETGELKGCEFIPKEKQNDKK